MAKRVSRGISELIANAEDMREERTTEDKVTEIALEKLIPNPDQPRKTFNEDSLKELADSIASHGVIQPLLAKKDGARYIIVAGERRYRAAMLAGLETVPVIVKNYDERATREISLIENLQREDLNAIEEAEAIRELMDSFDLTQEEIASKLGKSRPAIANSLRLLNCPKVYGKPSKRAFSARDTPGLCLPSAIPSISWNSPPRP